MHSVAVTSFPVSITVAVLMIIDLGEFGPNTFKCVNCLTVQMEVVESDALSAHRCRPIGKGSSDTLW